MLETHTPMLLFIQEAHAGQKYGNMPYWFHPLEVMAMAREIFHYADKPKMSFGDQEFIRQTIEESALLHDVIEDTDYTADDLMERFAHQSVYSTTLLTKDASLDYEQNIQRIIDSGDIPAMFTKLADNLVNRNGDKSQMEPIRAAMLNTRYAMSINMLMDALEEKGYTVYVTRP